MKILKSRIEILSALALSVLPLTACNHAPPAAEKQPTNVGVETSIVHSTESTDYLEVPAHVTADPAHVVHIYPPLSGRILGLNILPGQNVVKGQVIAQLQSNDIAVARSDFEKAKIEVIRADSALNRGKLLVAHDVLSQADFAELQATDQVAHSELDRARQHIHELGFAEDSVSDTVALRAPISGVVLDIGTATGEMQRSLDNATSIATIANLDSVWIVGDVFEKDLASLRRGRAVDIVVPAYPDLKLTGRIDNVSDALDPATHTLNLRVVLANTKHLLKSDMFATIRIAGAVRSTFIVPSTAVLHEGDKTFVFVADSSGKFDQRTVTVGRSLVSGTINNIEILSGLNDGDKVVTTGGALLRPTSGD
jgi:cobalt-zinc-cadmium efflux system membrane fusion protein